MEAIQAAARNASMVKASLTKLAMYVEAGAVDSLLQVIQSLVNRIGVEKTTEETSDANPPV